MDASTGCFFVPQVRHIFAGCHTPDGFRSYFDYILPKYSAHKIYLLKGGIFSERSEILSKTGKCMLSRGTRTEFMHNAIKTDDLDCVSFPETGVALLNNSEFIGFNNRFFEIEDVFIDDIQGDSTAIVNDYYIRACRYLRTAANSVKEAETRYLQNIDRSRMMDIAEALSIKLFQNICNNGSIRRLFSSAITPEGIINLKDSVLSGYENIIGIEGGYEGVTGAMLSMIADRAVNRGYDIEVFHSALFPDRIEHITIPSISSAISTINKDESGLVKYGEIIELNKYKLDKYKAVKETVAGNNVENMADELADRLIDMAVAALSNARQIYIQGETNKKEGNCKYNIDDKVNYLIEKVELFTKTSYSEQF